MKLLTRTGSNLFVEVLFDLGVFHEARRFWFRRSHLHQLLLIVVGVVHIKSCLVRFNHILRNICRLKTQGQRHLLALLGIKLFWEYIVELHDVGLHWNHNSLLVILWEEDLLLVDQAVTKEVFGLVAWTNQLTVGFVVSLAVGTI